MNGFSAADMSTAAANGHRDGYQAGYADAVKAMDHIGDANKMVGAAQEAVAIEQIAQQWDGCMFDSVGETIDIGDAIRAAGKRLAPVAAAPVGDFKGVAERAVLAFARVAQELGIDPAGGADTALAAIAKLRTPAAPGIDLHAPCTEAVYALARKLLWIAYVWNDHNFDHPYQIARKLAQEFGIESFDQANAWLTEQAKLIDASPKGHPTRSYPLDALGNPMREHQPGAWESAQWPSDAIPKGGERVSIPDDLAVSIRGFLSASFLPSAAESTPEMRQTYSYWQRRLLRAGGGAMDYDEATGAAKAAADSPKGGSDAKDAARYRWLRSGSGATWDQPWVAVGHCDVEWSRQPNEIEGKQLDDAIDAAMQATSAEVGA